MESFDMMVQYLMRRKSVTESDKIKKRLSRCIAHAIRYYHGY